MMKNIVKNISDNVLNVVLVYKKSSLFRKSSLLLSFVEYFVAYHLNLLFLLTCNPDIKIGHL
jgi:hypothetical protein